MAGLLNTSSILMCPHGGTVQVIPGNTRTKAAGDFVLRQSDTYLVVGCPFVVGPMLHPCLQIQWVLPAAQSQVQSDFTLTEESVGLCVAGDQAVQGVALIVFTQPRVVGQ